MAVTRFDAGDAVNEGSSAQYEATFYDATGAALAASAITAITATLKNEADDAVINGRDNQNVRNVNGGALDAGTGTFTIDLDGSDNVIVGTPPATDVYQAGWKRTGAGLEEHRLTLKVIYSKTGGGTGTLTHEVRFFVQNLEDVT